MSLFFLSTIINRTISASFVSLCTSKIKYYKGFLIRGLETKLDKEKMGSQQNEKRKEFTKYRLLITRTFVSEERTKCIL